jgi:(p)ppGpp synthase/HD superfamily hydrolase
VTEVQASLQTTERASQDLGDRFIDALGYSARAHAGQRRANDGQPYVAHLLRVAGLVIQDGGPEDEAIAALLHDAVEDQGGLERLNDIRERYGDAVADIVDECTDSYGDPKPPWRARKERYLAELEDSSPGALRVSTADKLDNVNSLIRAYRIEGEELWAHSNKSADDVRWYYGTLAARFAELRPGPLSDELCRTVAQLERALGEHQD